MSIVAQGTYRRPTRCARRPTGWGCPTTACTSTTATSGASAWGGASSSPGAWWSAWWPALQQPPAADLVPIPAGLYTVDLLLAAADRLPEGARWQLVQRLLDRLQGRRP